MLDGRGWEGKRWNVILCQELWRVAQQAERWCERGEVSVSPVRGQVLEVNMNC